MVKNKLRVVLGFLASRAGLKLVEERFFNPQVATITICFDA